MQRHSRCALHHATHCGYDGHVLPRTYENQVCSVARALELVGDRWTMLVIREAFMGIAPFR